MRRIPRPQRSIGQALPSSYSVPPRTSLSPCRAVLTFTPLLRNTCASFCTSSRYNGILDGKQDKRKHQAFVRRWQRRLLGDSEPIGAHVDPYDPTSPVRISPEETGEEQEVLDEIKLNEHGQEYVYHPYEEATSGEGLYRIGGKEWIQREREVELAERFEKLLQEPYPLDHEFKIRKGRPNFLPEYAFGRPNPIRDIERLRQMFHRAVVEVFALKQAGMDMDLATYPNRGQYGGLPWTLSEVKLSFAAASGVILNFPQPEAQVQLLRTIQESSRPEPEQEDLIDEVEELVVEHPGDVVTPAEAAKHPVVKGGALIKQTEGKPFDFMSNRPVPRTNPKGITPTVVESVETISTAKPVPSLNVESVFEDSRKAIAEMRQTVLEVAAQRSSQSVSAILKEVRGNAAAISKTINVFGPDPGSRYRDIPLTDPAIKFALSKRLTKLTGLRIPDVKLNFSNTLGDIYENLVVASKPQPKKLFDMIKLESKLHPNKKNPGAEQLPQLPNVRLHRKKITPMDKDRQVGRWKVIEYALAERDLPILTKDA